MPCSRTVSGFFLLNVPSEAFGALADAAGLQINRGPMPLRVEHSPTDIRDGFHGAIRLLLFERYAKPVDASITVQVEWM